MTLLTQAFEKVLESLRPGSSMLLSERVRESLHELPRMHQQDQRGCYARERTRSDDPLQN